MVSQLYIKLSVNDNFHIPFNRSQKRIQTSLRRYVYSYNSIGPFFIYIDKIFRSHNDTLALYVPTCCNISSGNSPWNVLVNHVFFFLYWNTSIKSRFFFPVFFSNNDDTCVDNHNCIFFRKLQKKINEYIK